MYPRCTRNGLPAGRIRRQMRCSFTWAQFALPFFVLCACSSAPKPIDPMIAPVPVVSAVPAVVTEQFDRAVTLLGAGDLDLAVREFETMSAAYPEYAGPLINLGIAYTKSGHLPEAEQAFKMAISRNPDNAVAYNQLGIVYRKLGRFIDAGGAYERALQIAPDYALAHLNLGVLYDLYLQRPEKALGEYEKYVMLSGTPDNTVNGWIAEVSSRLGTAARTARSEP